MSRMQTGAVILCGGKSTRMGRDKATLQIGPEMMLQRVIRLLSEVVEQNKIVVVAAVEQKLPVLPTDVIIIRDRRADRGPLEGLAAGLGALQTKIEAAYVTGCDAPLLVPAFVSRMFQLLGDYDLAVPCESQQFHPLAAVYRPHLYSHIQQLLQTDRLRLRFLIDEVRTRIVEADELRDVDPTLQTLINLNFPQDYRSALLAAGYAAELPDVPTPF